MTQCDTFAQCEAAAVIIYAYEHQDLRCLCLHVT